jgi:hypothetical protein
MSEEQKRQQSERFRGDGNPFHGRKHSQDSIAKMSGTRGEIAGQNNPLVRAIQNDPEKVKQLSDLRKKIWADMLPEKKNAIFAKKRTGVGEISGEFWARVKSNAKSRGHAVEITVQQAWDLFCTQGKSCALSGEPLSFDKSNCTASLDRKDSSKNYTLDNVQWVHKTVNKMKNTLSDTELREWCLKITRSIT